VKKKLISSMIWSFPVAADICLPNQEFLFKEPKDTLAWNERPITGLYSGTLQIQLQWTLNSRTVWFSNNLKLEQLETRTTWNSNKKFEKNSVWNSSKNLKVEPWVQHSTASCGSGHHESANKNVASWMLLVSLHIGTSSSPIISV